MDINTDTSSISLEQEIVSFNQTFSQIEGSVAQVIVGQHDIVRMTLAAIFAGGHVLLEGVPGLGKTLLVKSIAKTLGLSFKRIQFTPDLMPTDVTGTQILSEDQDGKRRFSFAYGPVFANIVLADEINRATPKTQAALLEAMEEKQITIFGETYLLANPFFVLATQNPIELEGTYPLPEAQLDRFIVKLVVLPPSNSELREILNRTTGDMKHEISPLFGDEPIVPILEKMRYLVRKVIVADPLQEVLIRMIDALSPESDFAPESVRNYVRFGPGPRGAQAVIMCAKVLALIDSRINLAFEDIRSVLLPALRHRLVLNFQAEADGVTADDLIMEIKNAK